jgi:hypothetical protein
LWRLVLISSLGVPLEESRSLPASTQIAVDAVHDGLCLIYSISLMYSIDGGPCASIYLLELD